MKTSLQSIFFISIVFLCVAFKQQESHTVLVKEAGLTLTLPNDKWEEIKEKKASKPTYHFRRTDVKISTEKPLYPEVVITVDHLKSVIDLTQYSLQKQKPFSTLANYKVEKVFTDSDGMLKLKYAVGTKASYTDLDKVKHTFYFIHAVRKGVGLQILIDTPSYLFDSYEEELASIIKSLEYKQQ